MAVKSQNRPKLLRPGSRTIMRRRAYLVKLGKSQRKTNKMTYRTIPAVFGIGRNRLDHHNLPRNDLAERGIEPVIPPRSNRKTPIEYDREAYKRRTRIERCVNRLKQFRRIATRYEKTARAYLSMLCVAAAKLWIKTVNTARLNQQLRPVFRSLLIGVAVWAFRFLCPCLLVDIADRPARGAGNNAKGERGVCWEA